MERMKTPILLLICLCVAGVMPAQAPLSRPEALKQLYRGYDPEKGTAQLACTEEQERNSSHAGWSCGKEYSTVSVTVLLMAEVQEGGTDKVYLVTSAVPANAPEGYECHACAPAVGVAVFQAQEGNWALRSANAAIGFYGGWGRAPEVVLVHVGPEERGFLLSSHEVAQGYAWSNKTLLMPIDRTVAEVWSLQDEQDNLRAIDPDDKLNKQVPYRSSAAFRFYAAESEDGGSRDYYDIEVISRGTSSEDLTHLKPENWTEIYRFSDGKYKMLRHRDFGEVKKAAKKLLPPKATK
jgi:hypothetical protein